MNSPLGTIEIPAIPTFASERDQLAWLIARHDELEYENAELRFKNLLWQNQLYGKKSERMRQQDEESGQQRLFDTPVADDVTGPDVADDEKKIKRKRGDAQKRTHARKPINPTLDTIVREHGATGPRQAADGTPMAIISWDERRRLHMIPEQVVCLLDRYAIWGYSDTRETVEVTPILPSIIPGGKLSDDFLCEIARRKYLLSLPLHRQLRDLNAIGAELAVSTMCDGIRALATFLEPIHLAIRAQILRARLMHVDETTMRQQSDEYGSLLRYLWAWHADRQVSFHYGGRSAEEIRAILANIEPPADGDPPRSALTDGYVAYDAPFREANIRHHGCWAHIRRDFKPLALQMQHAKEIFHEISTLYRCEKAIKKAIEKQSLSGAAAEACRLEYRQRDAQPALNRIADYSERYQPLYNPKGLLGSALTKLTNQFGKLRIYAETGHVPIDNNTVERDMRQVAIGRKNYLFVGSEDAGTWCAIMYSLIESARLSNLDVRTYLARAVAGIHAGEDPATLTPAVLREVMPAALG